MRVPPICFRWNLWVPPRNELTLFWRYFSTRSKFFTWHAFWKEISVFFFISSWDFDIRCSSLYCCADCSCCSCCCSSEINLIFLHSALDHVSSSGSWKRLWSLTTAVERTVSFPSVDLAFFSPVLSYYFSFAKDSKESVIESPKRCSDESSTVSVNLAYYWTGSDGLMKLLLR